MDDAAIHRELEAVAEQLGVEIRVDDLHGCKSGMCKLGGKRFLLIDVSLSLAERVGLMLDEIVHLPLETVFVRPQVRELLEARDVGFSPNEPIRRPIENGETFT